MNKVVLLLAVLTLALAVPALSPGAAAIGNCPNGWSGVIVTQPNGQPFGVCCTLTTPTNECAFYRLAPP